MSGVAGVGHRLDGSSAVQPQKSYLDHIGTWIEKLEKTIDINVSGYNGKTITLTGKKAIKRMMDEESLLKS